MLAFVVSITGAIGSLVLLVIQFLSSRKQRFPGLLGFRSVKIWKTIPAFLAFLCFIAVAFSIYHSQGEYSPASDRKRELALEADSLSDLLSEMRKQQAFDKGSHLRREEELTSALKSRITNAYTLTTPVIHRDTIVIVVRDTANERKLKGRLENMQLKNFELLKTIDSLRLQNAANDKEEK
jgi:hypothetical protein